MIRNDDEEVSNDVGNHVFSFFRNYPEENMVNLRRIPQTEIRERMIDMNKNSVERFFEELEGLIEERTITVETNGKTEVVYDKKDIYREYLEFCHPDGGRQLYKPFPPNRFFNAIPKQYKTGVEGRTQRNRRNIGYIGLNIPTLD